MIVVTIIGMIPQVQEIRLLVKTLISVLEKKYHIAHNLRTILLQKQRAIMNREHTILTSSLKEEEREAKKFEEIEKDYVLITKECSTIPLEDFIVQCTPEEQKKLQQLTEDIKIVMSQIQYINQQNASLLDVSKKVIDDAMKLIKEKHKIV